MAPPQMPLFLPISASFISTGSHIQSVRPSPTLTANAALVASFSQECLAQIRLHRLQQRATPDQLHNRFDVLRGKRIAGAKRHLPA